PRGPRFPADRPVSNSPRRVRGCQTVPRVSSTSWRPGAWPLNRASGRHYNGSRQLSEMHHRRDQRGGRAMATKRVVATWLVGIALGVPAAGDETREVTGRVVAEDGRPVAGAEVATLWDALGGSQMRPFQASRTGQDGWFRLKVSFWQGH